MVRIEVRLGPPLIVDHYNNIILCMETTLPSSDHKIKYVSSVDIIIEISKFSVDINNDTHIGTIVSPPSTTQPQLLAELQHLNLSDFNILTKLTHSNCMNLPSPSPGED